MRASLCIYVFAAWAAVVIVLGFINIKRPVEVNEQPETIIYDCPELEQ